MSKKVWLITDAGRVNPGPATSGPCSCGTGLGESLAGTGQASSAFPPGRCRGSFDRLPVRGDKTTNLDSVADINCHQVFTKLNRASVALSHERKYRSRHSVEV